MKLLLCYVVAAVAMLVVNSATIDLLKPQELGKVRITKSQLLLLENRQTLVAYGSDLHHVQRVLLFARNSKENNSCETAAKRLLTIKHMDNNRIDLVFDIGDPLKKNIKLYLCTSESVVGTVVWKDQGPDIYVVYSPAAFGLPVWATVLLIIVAYILAAIFSGLNLGLMGLTTNELRIIMNTGSPEERRYAKEIYPLRRQGNVMLTAILLVLCACNSLSTVLFDNLFEGTVAVVVSTILIVVLVEIVPQSLFSRHALKLAAKTRYVSWLFLILTFPVSYPLGKLLNVILKNKEYNTYNKFQLIEIVRTSCEKELDPEEKNIVFGGLKFKDKVAGDIMVKLEDCFMVKEDDVIDEKFVETLMASGYTRIPVYREKRENITGLIHSTDIAFISPDDKVPVLNVKQAVNRGLVEVYSETKLGVILKEFRSGKSHMAIVTNLRYHETGPPSVYALGVLTLEDIIHEILHFDRSNTNRQQRAMKHIGSQEDWLKCKKILKGEMFLNPQLIKSICRFLSVVIDQFSDRCITPEMLMQLVCKKGNIITFEPNGHEKFLYQKDVPYDFFTLILEGEVEIEVGAENLSFNQGPYNFYGEDTLQSVLDSAQSRSPYLPRIRDFSVKLRKRAVYLKITARQFEEAVTLSRMQKVSGYNPQLNISNESYGHSYTATSREVPLEDSPINDKVIWVDGPEPQPNADLEEDLHRNDMQEL